MTLPVVCPRCGMTSESDRIDLDLADGESIACHGCDGEYTVADVLAILESWGPLLAWLDAHPARNGTAVGGVKVAS